MAMELKDFAALVRSMRRKQDEYFKTRSGTALNMARDYERRVDRAADEILDPPTAGLFDAEAQQ